jgi:3',5'-cyclic AMP phosphodiesterase CpdA
MATTFNWLHLTDLHLGMRGASDFWPTIERDFFKDVGLLTETYGPLDLVIFTGDLVPDWARAKSTRRSTACWSEFGRSSRPSAASRSSSRFPEIMTFPGRQRTIQ